MKTKLFLFATLLITTITFSQTSNKAELVDAIAKDAGLSKADAGKALNPFISNASGHLKKGNSVQLIGFGTSSISKKVARAVRNPQTGATIINNGTIGVTGNFGATKARHNWVPSRSRAGISKLSKKE